MENDQTVCMFSVGRQLGTAGLFLQLCSRQAFQAGAEFCLGSAPYDPRWHRYSWPLAPYRTAKKG
ncbi:MAG: hypothetical protein U9P37_06770 [Pseudomonadota bacterium]|nr:hypothetical protein [Pseudomonadota bacterium]